MRSIRGIFIQIMTYAACFSPSQADQAADAARLEEMLTGVAAWNFPTVEYTASINGCQARLSTAHFEVAFRMSSISYDPVVLLEKDHVVYLRLTEDSVDNSSKFQTKLDELTSLIDQPRTVVCIFFDNQDDYDAHERELLQRQFERTTEVTRNYSLIRNGDLGEWLQQNHWIFYSREDFSHLGRISRPPHLVSQIHMLSGVPLRLSEYSQDASLEPGILLKLANIIDAMRAYTEAYCLPAPEYD